jgi:hypothetical protein
MINLKKLNKIGLGIFALSFLLLTACELEPSSKIDPTASEALSADAKNKLSLLELSTLPKGLENGLDPKLNFGSESARQVGSGILSDQQYWELVMSILNAVPPSECSTTEPRDWLTAELSDWSADDRFYANYFILNILPGDLARVFENSSEGQSFGVNGEYTQPLTKTFKDLKRFWDIQSQDMVMVAMHGKMMYDRERVVQVFQLYGNSLATSEWAADNVITLLNERPAYRNGDHPIFTFNAYAARAKDFIPPYGPVPDKITMGDGIMDSFTDLGFEDVAPQAILAHEFGHHIQFDLNLFDSPITDRPEATRRIELMADAYAAYFLSHSRGAAMQWKRVQQFLAVFFNIGDCQFASNGHHGTPIQRMAAAEWGYKLADNAKKQGHILTSQEFADLFEAQLPILVAP